MWHNRCTAAPRAGRKTASFHPTIETLETRIALTKVPKGLVETPVAAGLNVPTAMEIAPDGRVFVLEQTGAVRVIEDGALLAQPFVTITVDTGPTSDSERGLLGIAFDPDFANNNFVYFYYSHPDGGGNSHNVISRFTANGNTAEPNSEQIIFNSLPTLVTPYHNGGAIHFRDDGKLYVGVGDNDAFPDEAQSLNSLLGKMLRLNADGTIPTDNPFFVDPNVIGDNKAIWTMGLRNPFTFATDPTSSAIFINDVGDGDGTVPVAYEEINIGIAGSNYGWPQEQGENVNAAFLDPIFTYKHGKGLKKGCAIVGGTFYTPTTPTFPEKYQGDYFFADLCNRWIRAYIPAEDRALKFAKNTADQIVDLKVENSGGLLYLARGLGTDTGVVNRISPPGAGPVAPRAARPLDDAAIAAVLLNNADARVLSIKQAKALSLRPGPDKDFPDRRTITMNAIPADMKDRGSQLATVDDWFVTLDSWANVREYQE